MTGLLTLSHAGGTSPAVLEFPNAAPPIPVADVPLVPLCPEVHVGDRSRPPDGVRVVQNIPTVSSSSPFQRYTIPTFQRYTIPTMFIRDRLAFAWHRLAAQLQDLMVAAYMQNKQLTVCINIQRPLMPAAVPCAHALVLNPVRTVVKAPPPPPVAADWTCLRMT